MGSIFHFPSSTSKSRSSSSSLTPLYGVASIFISLAQSRKHSHIVATCKSALDKLESLTDDSSASTPLYGVASVSDAESFIQPLILAIDSSSPKVVEPALDYSYRLFSLRLIRCEIDPSEHPHSIIFCLIDSICKCSGLGEEAVELAILKTLLAILIDRIQLQHKFWQPYVQQDSITAQFNYSRIQLHSSYYNQPNRALGL